MADMINMGFGNMPDFKRGHNMLSRTNENATEISKHDDLIITQPEHAKTSSTTKNGRYISRLVDSVNKLQKRDKHTQHDKDLYNFSLYWYIRMLLLSHDSFDDVAIQTKLFSDIDLLNKFDRNSSDYDEKIQYLYRVLDTINNDRLNELGIDHDNFMYRNVKSYDSLGITTFQQDKFFTYDDLDIKKATEKDQPERELPDFPTEELSNMTVDTTDTTDTVPKILHILYYKGTVDTTYLYSHLATYTANRDYKIYVWLNKIPEHGLRSNNHVEFKTFDMLECGNYSDDSEAYSWEYKFMLKYYILKQYGGIYTDYSIAGVKKFPEHLAEQSFMSVFTNVYKEQEYVCPLGFFMGFSQNHPYINYIIEHFQKGADVCKTEYIYLRSVLMKYKSIQNMPNIRLLLQNVDNTQDNRNYVVLRTNSFKEGVKYFDYKDFDQSDTEQTESEQTESEQTEEEKSEIAKEIAKEIVSELAVPYQCDPDQCDPDQSIELTEEELAELEGIENMADTIATDVSKKSWSIGNYFVAYAVVAIFAYFYRTM